MFDVNAHSGAPPADPRSTAGGASARGASTRRSPSRADGRGDGSRRSGLDGDGRGDGAERSDRRGDGRADGTERSDLQELVAMFPDVARLLPALVTDPRVPLRTKLIAGAALAYVAVPIDPMPELVPGTGIGIDDLFAIAVAVRHLITGAGYEVVHERWDGTDAGFAFLLLFTGVAA